MDIEFSFAKIIDNGGDLQICFESFHYTFKHDFYDINIRFFFFLLGPYPWHMEVPRLGVEL